MGPLRISFLAAVLTLSANAATLLHSYAFTGNVNDGTGTENGTLLDGASVSGGVLVLDGVNDYVEFGTGLIPSSGSFSVVISAKLAVSPTAGFMEAISQGSSGNAFYLGSILVDGRVRAGDDWLDTGVAYPADGLWHTFAVTRDSAGTVSTLYIDGVSKAVSNDPFDNVSASTPTRFGRQYNGHGEYWNGELDNVRIYEGVLTGGEVLALSGGETPERWTMALTGAGLVLVGLRRRPS